MTKKLILWMCCMAGMVCTAMAQGTISGRVYDSKTGHPIEYATVAVLKVKDSSLVTGTVTEANGSFSTKANNGTYLVRISFMGYQTYFHPHHVTLNEKHNAVNLGKIQIAPSGACTLELS